MSVVYLRAPRGSWMRMVIDVPENTLRRVRALIEAGHFSDLSVFLLAAIENQVVLEESSPGSSNLNSAVDESDHGVASRANGLQGQGIDLFIAPGTATRSVIAPPSRLSSATADQVGWIWGLLNRLLPLKAAARVLANLTSAGPVSLSDARKQAGSAASRLGARLLERDRLENRAREEKLAIGFPVRRPADKSLGRYVDHFVGRLRVSGEVTGGLFDLGFAGVLSDGGSDPA